MIIAFGGIVLQSVVNGFGFLFIAGYTATNKLYGILEVVAISFGYAITTFVSQNYGAKKYQIYRATGKKGKYSKIATRKKLTYEDTSLNKNKTYYYKVRAYRIVNGEKIYSSFSTVKQIKCK